MTLTIRSTHRSLFRRSEKNMRKVLRILAEPWKKNARDSSIPFKLRQRRDRSLSSKPKLQKLRRGSAKKKLLLLRKRRRLIASRIFARRRFSLRRLWLMVKNSSTSNATPDHFTTTSTKSCLMHRTKTLPGSMRRSKRMNSLRTSFQTCFSRSLSSNERLLVTSALTCSRNFPGQVTRTL